MVIASDRRVECSRLIEGALLAARGDVTAVSTGAKQTPGQRFSNRMQELRFNGRRGLNLS
jgi:hypothetical protein